MKQLRRVPALLVMVTAGTTACSGQLDAGYDIPHGALPVDERSATIVMNEGALDNWQGEYAALFAASGQLRMVGLIVNSSTAYPSLEANVGGFRQMITAARASGMKHLPDVTASVAPPLTAPQNGVIEETVPNRSEGARLILQAAAEHATPVHPLALATGGALTDIADAYLLDPSLAERAVVVASLGRISGGSVFTDTPNGDLDSWATFIVASRMRYMQVNGFYDQLQDVPDDQVAGLPKNPFGQWMAAKRASILNLGFACDQVSVLSVALPYFALDVTRMRVDNTDPVMLTPDANGSIWHVGGADSDRMRAELWAKLNDPSTFR
ncbi:MAG TPA: hypothetical protein VNG33_00435 [Polyangiaceae bacterium]|nr:hypothetical protein [Polyangiaceae bacterium]